MGPDGTLLGNSTVGDEDGLTWADMVSHGVGWCGMVWDAWGGEGWGKIGVGVERGRVGCTETVSSPLECRGEGRVEAWVG